MTWVVKVRGDAKALMAAEYECPVHGRFGITAPRDEIPDELPCPVETERYDGRFRSMREYCGLTSPWCFPSPARTKVQRVYAARKGKDPEPPPNTMNWQALAYDEMSPDDWHAAERKKDWLATRKLVKEALR